MNYYDRTTTPNSDGTPIFYNEGDRQNEAEAKAAIEKAWGCELRPFSLLCPIDWYAVRDGRLVGVVELKSRSHEWGRYPTIFLSVHKWIALTMAGIGLGVPAVFVVKCLNRISFIPIARVNAGNHRIAGSLTKVEPIIDVPVEDFRTIGEEK